MPQDTAPGSGAYDFLNQESTKSTRKLLLPKLPKLAWIILIGSVSILFILVMIALLFGGGNQTNTSPYIESLAYGEEINRVSDSVKELSEDPNTQSLAATTSSVLTSNNTELTAYLKKIGVKVETKNLSSKLDKEIDTQMTEASQANRLPETYARYLSIYLEDYQNSLKTAYDQSGTEGRALIKEAFDSVEIILSVPAVKTAGGS